MRAWMIPWWSFGCTVITREPVDTGEAAQHTDVVEVPELTEVDIHRPGEGWTPVPINVLFAGWKAGDETPPDGTSWDCEAAAWQIADRPEDITGFAAQARDMVPAVRGFDGTFEDAFIGWSWYCPDWPRTMSVLGAWENAGVLRVSWYAPEGGNPEPGRPWMVALIPQRPWAAVVTDFFLVPREEE